jgi:hypothetical protein
MTPGLIFAYQVAMQLYMGNPKPLKLVLCLSIPHHYPNWILLHVSAFHVTHYSAQAHQQASVHLHLPTSRHHHPEARLLTWTSRQGFFIPIDRASKSVLL